MEKDIDTQRARQAFEKLANKDAACGLRRSLRGTYINTAIARDWKWFQLGLAQGAASGEFLFLAGKAAGRQEIKDAQQSPDFETWVNRAYRDAYESMFTVYNMEVAWQAGRASKGD